MCWKTPTKFIYLLAEIIIIILACTATPNMPQKIALGYPYPFTLQKTLEMQHNNNYA